MGLGFESLTHWFSFFISIKDTLRPFRIWLPCSLSSIIPNPTMEQTIAPIECRNGKRSTTRRWGIMLSDDPNLCNRQLPLTDFSSLSRSSIRQLTLYKTGRVIAAPGGNCKLLDEGSNGLVFLDHGLKLTGSASSPSMQHHRAVDIFRNCRSQRSTKRSSHPRVF